MDGVRREGGGGIGRGAAGGQLAAVGAADPDAAVLIGMGLCESQGGGGVSNQDALLFFFGIHRYDQSLKVVCCMVGASTRHWLVFVGSR